MKVDIDKQLKLYEIILCDDKISFLNFSVPETKELIKKNLSLDNGIKLMKRQLENINYSGLLENFIFAPEISGSESEVLFKENDDEFIYKLNDPRSKIDDKDFNSYIWNLILQEWLFPKCKYSDFKYVNPLLGDSKIFMKQKMIDARPITQGSIDRLMDENGFTFRKDLNGYAALLNINDGDEIILLITDLNPSNARIINDELLAFDPRFKLI